MRLLLLLLVVATFAEDLPTDSKPPYTLSNWVRNVRFSTQDIQYPRNVSEVVSIVKNAKGKIRVLGTQHSFNKIADVRGTLIATRFLDEIIKFDSSVPSVTIGAGVTYEKLLPFIDGQGFAIISQPGANDISIVGAAQTGTDGNGIGFGNVATQIRSLEIVLPNGSVKALGPNDPELKAVALGLGVFGVITSAEVIIRKKFETKDYIFVGMPVQSILDHFYDIQNLGEVMSMFTNLSDLTRWSHVWIRVPAINDPIGAGELELFGAKRANKTVSLGDVTGLAQWFIPYDDAVPAIHDFLNIGDKITSLIKSASIRTVDEDDLWMSPCYLTKCMAIEVFWNTKDIPNMDVSHAVLTIEEILKKHNARPHWGKVHEMTSDYYAKLFPRIKDFKKLADTWDPQGKFRNDFVDEIFKNVE